MTAVTVRTTSPVRSIHHHVSRPGCTGRTTMDNSVICWTCANTLGRWLPDSDFLDLLDDEASWEQR